jgi:hypothetical protein
LTQVLGEIEAEFGVMIAAAPEHLHWLKGACASVRYFMGDTPICVLLDGDRSLRDLETAYGIRVVRRAEVDHAELRNLSFGSLKTKNATHWLSPFETYLFLDADAVAWGDMRLVADLERFDLVIDSPIADREKVRRWVMDSDSVARHFPDFDARAHVDEYVNTGAHFARRGTLDLDRYLELLRFSATHPGLFYGSQGVFNFMVFSAADEGKVRLDQRELQVTTGDTTREEVVDRFRFERGLPHVVGAPAVLHWAGSPKPTVRTRGRDYFAPMTFFRRQFRIAVRGGTTSPTDGLRLRIEDMLCADWRGSNLRGRQRRLRRRAGQAYACFRVALRARVPDRIVAIVRR